MDVKCDSNSMHLILMYPGFFLAKLLFHTQELQLRDGSEGNQVKEHFWLSRFQVPLLEFVQSDDAAGLSVRHAAPLLIIYQKIKPLCCANYKALKC